MGAPGTIDTMYICDPEVHEVCPCLVDDDEPSTPNGAIEFDCACQPVGNADTGLECFACTSTMIQIDVDTGRRIEPPIKRRRRS